MTRPRTILLAITTLLMAAAASGQPHCKAAADECADKIREILSHRRYLGVTLVETRWGTTIKEVAPDSPAQRAGLQANDRIIGINNHDCTGADPQEVKQLLMPGGKPEQVRVTIVVSRLGEVRRFEATLGLMPNDKIEKIVERHLETAHRNQNGDR